MGCDDNSSDTATAFQHKTFADILWVVFSVAVTVHAFLRKQAEFALLHSHGITFSANTIEYSKEKVVKCSEHF